MIGLGLLFFFALWVWLAFILGKRIPRWLGLKRQKPVAALIILLMIAGPFADEFIGKYQFKRLCDKYAGVQSTTPNQSYATLRPVASEQFHLTDTINPAYVFATSYVGLTGSIVIRSEISVDQKDGWFLRWLNLAGTSSCGGVNMFTLPLEEQTAIRELKYPQVQVRTTTTSQLQQSLEKFKPQTKERTK